MSTNQLVMLIYHEMTEASQASVRRTCDLLEEEGILSHIRFTPEGRSSGSPVKVWGFTERGAEESPNPNAKSFSGLGLTLPHQMKILDFHLYIHEQKIEHIWTEKNLMRGGVNPDACFSLKLKTGWFNFFLDPQRAKNGHDAEFEKMLPYLDIYNTDKCERLWGFRQFRVLIPHRSVEAMRNLLFAMASPMHQKRCPAKRSKSYTCKCKPTDPNPCNSRIFWLTTEELYKADQYKTSQNHSTETYSLKAL